MSFFLHTFIKPSLGWRPSSSRSLWSNASHFSLSVYFLKKQKSLLKFFFNRSLIVLVAGAWSIIWIQSFLIRVKDRSDALARRQALGENKAPIVFHGDMKKRQQTGGSARLGLDPPLGLFTHFFFFFLYHAVILPLPRALGLFEYCLASKPRQSDKQWPPPARQIRRYMAGGNGRRQGHKRPDYERALKRDWSTALQTPTRLPMIEIYCWRLFFSFNLRWLYLIRASAGSVCLFIRRFQQGGT